MPFRSKPRLTPAGLVFKAIPVVLFFIFIALTNVLLASREHEAKVTFLGNTELLASMVRDIGQAQHSVSMAMYLFKSDVRSDAKGTMLVYAALTDAARRGVKVQVVLDEDMSESSFITKENRLTAKRLRKAGAEVRLDTPKRRLHAKMTVIDSRIVYIGSHNLTYSALMRNNEASVRIVSEELAKEAELFMEEVQ